MDGIEAPIKLETLVLPLVTVVKVSAINSPGVPGRDCGATSTGTISSSSDCSEDDDDSEERLPTMMN